MANLKGRAKGKKLERVRRWERHGWKTPYVPGSMVEEVFLAAMKGCKIIKLKEIVFKRRQTKKGGGWVLTDLRNGSFNGAKWKWNEKDGFVKIDYNPPKRMKRPEKEVEKKAPEAKEAKAA